MDSINGLPEQRFGSEGERVFIWRTRFCECLGYGPAASKEIADDPRIDVHTLERLVLDGCERDIARRIVAPL